MLIVYKTVFCYFFSGVGGIWLCDSCKGPVHDRFRKLIEGEGDVSENPTDS